MHVNEKEQPVFTKMFLLFRITKSPMEVFPSYLFWLEQTRLPFEMFVQTC